ncbi:type II toxin-antitoxin system HicA family toxin [Patescibacteria group bacterium]|nr:type II toxin-antitoxin system HicA family toxin [Patescibacteria group bacterium]MDE1946534.1 type II toxin-antitoxin system HicA family toxin [Patescibacteria group bacterium]MDE2010905.1 type II toxin-antitoxin system HicA family toxin [Patescibacteria group bacterium]MDE2232789.1 type II toxin-antitoxin system HicA family toxin [Patescibacteria group bacterium]
MPRLYSSKHIIKVLTANGFVFVSQRGSHIKYHKISQPGGESATVIIPADRKEVPQGTFASIIRQSGMNKNDFK